MRTYVSIFSSLICAGAMTVGAFSNAALGATLAVEHFDYDAGSGNLGTFDGGTGWTGGWKKDGKLTNASDASVQAAGLPVPTGYIGQEGGSAIGTGALVYRQLENDIHLDVDQDYYISLLTRRSGPAKSMTVSLMSSPTNTVAMFGHSTGGTLFVGGIGDTVLGTDPRIGTGGTPQESNTFLWVFKIAAKATGDDQVFLKTYRVGGSESVSATEPTTWELVGDPATSNSTVANRIGILTSGSQTLEFDEVRIGTSWQDVAPIPEPASMSLLGLGGVMLLARRRR